MIAYPVIVRIVIHVLGEPAPKGSGRAMAVRGRAVHVPSGSNVNARKLKSWDVAVREAALRVVGSVTAPPFVGAALRASMIFYMGRPGGHYGKGKRAGQLIRAAPRWPITKPDLSKLVRSTEDTLTGIVWDDDSRVVELFLRKCYGRPGEGGAKIIIESIEEIGDL